MTSPERPHNTEQPRLPEVLFGETHMVVAPGQGSQKGGMGAVLAERSVAAQNRWAVADQALPAIGGKPFSQFVWQATDEQLYGTYLSQTVIITDALARFDAMQEFQRLGEPGWFSGYSAGFPVGLMLAGSINLEGSLQLWRGRTEAFGYAIENSPQSSMLALHDVDPNLREDVKKSFKLVTCIDSSDNEEVVGGLVENVEAATEYLERNLRDQKKVPSNYVFPIAVDAAYHSIHMAKAVPLYTEVVRNLPIEPPKRGRLFAASTLKELKTRNDICEALIAQVTETEKYRGMIRALRLQGVAAITELNQHATLTAMHQNTRLPEDTVRGKREWITLPRLPTDVRPVTIGYRYYAPEAKPQP